MVEVLVAPDGVAWAVGYLRGQLTARSNTTLVASRVRDPRPATFMKVRLMGGTRSDVVRYAPMLVFEAWAPDDVAAFNLAALTEALVDAAVDLSSDCSRVVEVGGIVSQPDPDSGSARYVFSKMLYLRSTVLV